MGEKNCLTLAAKSAGMSFEHVPAASGHLDESRSKFKDINMRSDSRHTESMWFEFKNVNVSIEGKQILHNISGRVGSGQLCGILGGSGAGKTTLLNAISGRVLTRGPGTLSTLCCIEKCKRK